MAGNLAVDDFVVGGKEEGKIGRCYHTQKKKAVNAVVYTDVGKVKRMYALKIGPYLALELKVIFDRQISEKAEIVSGKWKGYRPLQKEYKIEQIERNRGLSFQKLHLMIHQIKSWIRTTYSWLSPFRIDRYFDEFCYRLHRSQSKNSILYILILRMVFADKVYQQNLICS